MSGCGGACATCISSSPFYYTFILNLTHSWPCTHSLSHPQVPTLAVVENMAYFLCGQCQTKHRVFGGGGGGEEGNAAKRIREVRLTGRE